MALFGTSGIRDLAPSVVSPSLALRVGQLLAGSPKFAGGQTATSGKTPPTIAVGFDGRRTGPMLKAALTGGAAGQGATVLDLGLCATPTLAWFGQQKKAAGAMITASHNPPEYNGIKLFWQGREMPKEEEARIEGALGKKQNLNSISWDRACAIEEAGAMAQEAHLKLLRSRIDFGLIGSRKPKVVVDCGNAAACALMPRALQEAGCIVQVLNGRPGEPYGRALEPNEKSLGSLSEAVRKSGADLGIAHDGDADRAIILDEKGEMLGLDVQLALAVKEELAGGIKRPGAAAQVVSTVESSLALRELVEAAGAQLEITPVGSLHVAARMRALGARFGGEPCGEYLFEGGANVPDGLMTGLYFVQMACARGPLSKLVAAIARYPVAREKIPCPNGKKKKAMEAVARLWPFAKPSKLDGLRSDLKEGWVLVRPSGTEPFVRITAEARNGKKLASMMDEIRPIVQKACQ